MIFRLLTCMLFVACCWLLNAQQPYTLQNFTGAQGLPQSQVFAAMQDSRGYMWFGTQGGGVCYFDGIDFQVFKTEDGLPSNFVNAVFEDSRHRIWVGTNRGFGWWDGKTWQSWNAFIDPVNALAELPDGRLLIGWAGCLAAFDADQQQLTEYPLRGVATRPPVLALLETKGEIWVGTNQGAYCLDRPGQSLTMAEGLPANLVRSIARDDQGRLWLATPGGIAVTDGTQRKVLTVHQNPQLQSARCLQPDRAGNMWVGTSEAGVSIWSPGDSSWTQISEKQKLPHHDIRALVCDYGGHIWAATSGGGVVRFAVGAFRHYDRTDGLAGDRVYAVLEDRAGRIWITASQNGLFLLDASGLRHFERDSGYLSGVKCRTLAEDQRGRIWVGTEGKGIVIFDSTGMRTLTKVQGLPGDWIQKIVPDPSGDMWVATASNGIARISFSNSSLFSIKWIGENEGLNYPHITTLALDTAAGTLWFGTQSGKAGWIAIKDSPSSPKNRVGAVFGLPPVPVSCLHIGGRDQIWAGTKGEGIFRLFSDASSRVSHFRPYPSADQLASKNIYLLQSDPTGNLWAGTENGVDKISFEGPGGKVKEVEHYGRSEGFLGIETCQEAAICDRAGNLWFGTMNGLTKHIPSGQQEIRVAPILHFEKTTLFYKPLGETSFKAWAGENGGILEGLKLPYNQNHLSFEFRAIDLSRPKSVQYRWKLDGSGTFGWSPLSPQASVNFAGLAPGQYTFWVQASSDGEVFSEPLRASFSIQKPFWETWWFRIAGAAVLFLILFLGIKSRVRQIRRTEQAKREQLEIQNHLLQLEQKALQLQMNPHFIFNALTNISALVARQDTATARQELQHFADLMRGILNNSRRPLITLQEEADTLRQYLRMEQFCQQNPFEFNIKIAEDLDADEVELPPMLLQPFVENAVVHGVSHLDRPGKIEIVFDCDTERSLLRCTIRDNGIGREKAARLRQERKPGHQSAALHITRERLEAMKTGGYSSLEIEDVLNEDGEIAGTQVRVQVPVQM